MNEKIYLLTGAAGNLGSSISRALVAQGEKVRALVLNGDPAADRIPSKVEIIAGDLMGEDSLEEFFTVEDGLEVIVIHCASIVAVASDYNQKVYDVNVNGTKNIIQKCLSHQVNKLVYISSTSAIPELPKGEIISEVDSFDPDLVIGFYGKTKAEATQLVLDAVSQYGLDASIIFPTGICGPFDYAYGHVANFIIDSVNGNMFTGVEGEFNAVDVRDLAKGVITCGEKGRKGEGYIMGNRTVTFRELFRLISKLSGAREVKFFLPLPVANVLAGILEAFSIVTKKPAVLTKFMIYNLSRNNNFSSDKAKRELDFHVRSFEQTIADEIDWLITEGKIK